MSKKSSIKQQDLDAFKNAVKGTRLLKKRKVQLTKPHFTLPLPKHNIHHDLEEIVLIETSSIPPVSGQEPISYKQTSISNKILRKLKKGQYNVEAVLDLHGMSVEKARTALSHFLQQCLNQELRVVLIIHGKGKNSALPPILKNKLNQWLRQLDIVLAAVTPFEGGAGTTLILLKNLSRRTTGG